MLQSSNHFKQTQRRSLSSICSTAQSNLSPAKYTTQEVNLVFLFLSVDFLNLCKIGNLFIVDLLFLLCFVLCQSLFMTAFPYPSFSRMSAATDITVSYVQCRIVHLTLMITQISRRRKCFQAFLTLKLFLPGMRCQLVKFKFLICRI